MNAAAALPFCLDEQRPTCFEAPQNSPHLHDNLSHPATGFTGNSTCLKTSKLCPSCTAMCPTPPVALASSNLTAIIERDTHSAGLLCTALHSQTVRLSWLHGCTALPHLRCHMPHAASGIGHKHVPRVAPLPPPRLQPLVSRPWKGQPSTVPERLQRRQSSHRQAGSILVGHSCGLDGCCKGREDCELGHGATALRVEEGVASG